jgi:3-oxoacyl-[acyl-carrier protein] reductase
MSRLSNKIAIVTGAGSGFGAAIARAYIKENAKVILADVNLEAARGIAAELGDNASAVACDVTQFDQVQAMVRHCVERFGVPSIVVNNAGTTHRNQSMISVTEQDFDRVFAVNVKSLYRSAKHCVPYFRQKGGGAFINIASTAGVRPRPGLVWYNGSKGAAIVCSRAMAVELAPDKIRVNVVNPVAGDTPLLGMFMGSDTPEMRAKFIASIPLGRLSKPLDIANACLYLASDEAEFITGACLEVDGGRCV